MTSDYSIGIQYNWRDGESYPLKAKLQQAVSNRIVVDEDHVKIYYPDDQAPGEANRKLLDRILPEALPVSDYSNIYLYVPLPPSGAAELRATGKVNVPAITDPTDFLANFPAADADLLAAIRADVRYAYYNELFRMMVSVAARSGMLHTLEFEFEGDEDGDTVFVSCMLED